MFPFEILLTAWEQAIVPLQFESVSRVQPGFGFDAPDLQSLLLERLKAEHSNFKALLGCRESRANLGNLVISYLKRRIKNESGGRSSLEVRLPRTCNAQVRFKVLGEK